MTLDNKENIGRINLIFCIVITQIFIFIKEGGGIIVKNSLLKIPNGNQNPQIEAARRDKCNGQK